MNVFKRIFSSNGKEQLVKVYSHPRSGTHFMEAFLARNFYPKFNLEIAPITWGHWSNRKVKEEGNPYGKLFGNHYEAKRNQNNLPKVYMVRDGRAVAYSIWKTPNFVNPNIKDLSFSEFLRTKIDWYATPSRKVEPKQTIVEHWIEHVSSWMSLAKENDNILIVNYESLIEDPYSQYKSIHKKFFKDKNVLSENEIEVVRSPVGLLPNKATKDSWKTIFTDEDNQFYLEQLPKEFNTWSKL